MRDLITRIASQSLCIRVFSTSAVHLKAAQFKALRLLPEDEIEESFTRGTGPGGQKINKTSVVAQLKHIPTGIVVKCQATRSQADNRRIGRKLLAEKVDVHETGDESRSAQKRAAVLKKKKSAQKKRNRKYNPDPAALSNADKTANQPDSSTSVPKLPVDLARREG